MQATEILETEQNRISFFVTGLKMRIEEAPERESARVSEQENTDSLKADKRDGKNGPASRSADAMLE